MLNLARSAFIVLAISVGIYLLQRDAARLVARPLERMLLRVRALAANPLGTCRARFEKGNAPDGDRLMETRILEVAFTKVCSLLAVGFGDAGAEVIGNNMQSGGDLNALVPGRRVAAIFGFCDIRQFTDATEVLQEDVMEFVNTIAHIVHLEVRGRSGVGRGFGEGRRARRPTLPSSLLPGLAPRRRPQQKHWRRLPPRVEVSGRRRTRRHRRRRGRRVARRGPGPRARRPPRPGRRVPPSRRRARVLHHHPGRPAPVQAARGAGQPPGRPSAPARLCRAHGVRPARRVGH